MPSLFLSDAGEQVRGLGVINPLRRLARFLRSQVPEIHMTPFGAFLRAANRDRLSVTLSRRRLTNC